MRKPLIICKHFPGKCFGCVDIGGTYYCTVLDTPITDHPCPFYKPQVEFELQIPHIDKPRFDYIDDVIERLDDVNKFSEEKVISDLFKEWVIDTCSIHLGADDFNAEVRCAITAYSHHIQNILADYYNINQEEGEYRH